MTISARDLTMRLNGRWSGTEGRACCPAHDDENPSLTIKDGTKRLLLRCQSRGCTFEQIRAALAGKGIDLGKGPRSAVPSAPAEQEPKAKWRDLLFGAGGHFDRDTLRYVSHDPTSAQEYLAGRGLDLPPNVWFDPRSEEMVVGLEGSVDGAFQGCQVTPLRRIKGGWKRGQRRTHGKLKGGIVRFGNRSSRLLLIAEGVETALSALKIVGDAQAWATLAATNMSSITIPARVQEVILCADHDEAGQKAAEELAQRVARTGKRVRVAIPDEVGADWNDEIIAARGKLKRLRRQILEAEEVENDGSLLAVAVEDFLAKPVPEREVLLSPWLPGSGLAMLYGPRGVGKTFLVTGIAYAVATGTEFLGWECETPGDVVIIDGEMPPAALYARHRLFQQVFGQPTDKRLRICYAELNGGRLPDLGTLAGQEQAETLLTDDTRLLILDNLSTLVRTGPENEADGWGSIQSWLIRLRARGISVLLVHHAGKTGQQRGTSRREDVLDTVLALKRPSGYSAEMGLAAECHFEKARTFFGPEAAPFGFRMTAVDGKMAWVRESLKESTADAVLRLHREGKTGAEIARALKVSSPAVSQHLAKMRRDGRLGEEDEELAEAG